MNLVAGEPKEVRLEKQAYGGWANCLRLSDGLQELIVTTDIGPRVIRYGLAGRHNMFKEYPEMLGKTGGSEWRIYGGHRLWHAPEIMPRTYAPDNRPVEHEWRNGLLVVTQPVETSTGIRKQIELCMSAERDEVRVVHRLYNTNLWDVELAPWALTVMAQGGRVIIPQEEFRAHDAYFLPARPVVLWHYTDMSDPRWTWGRKYIQLRQDPARDTPQKIGARNTFGWAAYALDGVVFVKRAPFHKDAIYPDFGSSMEFFTNADMLEVESLGPLTRVAPGGCVEHAETWSLAEARPGDDEESIDRMMGSLLVV
ncbi:MAG: hypothetical protein WCK47_06910 [bacterium]|nr:hypothetical protein [Candidatus Sumerlaeota bacterium]